MEDPPGLKLLRNNRGFILVDISLAVLIVSIALIPLMVMFYYSRLYLNGAQNLTAAVMIAQDGIEKAMDLPYNSLDSLPERGKEPVPGRPGFSRKILVSALPGYNLKTVVVAVYYPEAGREKCISLTARVN